MHKFKVFYKSSADGQTLNETIEALNHIDAEQKTSASHNLPFSRVLMSKDLTTGKLHTP